MADDLVLKEVLPRPEHKWGRSLVGHGEAQCVYCFMTNREAWVLGDHCDRAPRDGDDNGR